MMFSCCGTAEAVQGLKTKNVVLWGLDIPGRGPKLKRAPQVPVLRDTQRPQLLHQRFLPLREGGPQEEPMCCLDSRTWAREETR